MSVEFIPLSNSTFVSFDQHLSMFSPVFHNLHSILLSSEAIFGLHVSVRSFSVCLFVHLLFHWGTCQKKTVMLMRYLVFILALVKVTKDME